MSRWMEWAEAEISQGYRPGNAWERAFRRNLEESNPALTLALEADLEAYCQVRTAAAMRLAETMEGQGVPPAEARLLAMGDLEI